MKTTLMTLVATVTCLAASLSAAQAQTSEIYIHATYFNCNKALYPQADQSIAGWYGPELNDLVKRGLVSSWGWLAKNTGGPWERAQFFTGPGFNAVMLANAQITLKSDWRQAVKELAAACGSSENYVWHVLVGKNATDHLGAVVFSTYYICDQSREAPLDAVVKSNFAPKFDKLVTEGKLTSWAWAEQIVGGTYQRLATMSAASVDALIAARNEVALGNATSATCGSHQDYIWDVKSQG